MLRYRTIHKQATAEQTIEKSRFVAHVKPVETREEALSFISEVRANHRGATHNVPAYVLGEKNEIQWASDDGEPSGTSGAPILQMLIKEGITNVAVVVTRYFGGVKLGTGGLVRAYTGSAKIGLLAAGICSVKEMDLITVKLEYTYIGKIQNLSEGGDFQIRDQKFEDRVTLELATEPEKTDFLMNQLLTMTGGQVQKMSLQKVMVKF
jgi:uncharacterized YigZ family protein